jgi:hypothetical protein
VAWEEEEEEEEGEEACLGDRLHGHSCSILLPGRSIRICNSRSNRRREK